MRYGILVLLGILLMSCEDRKSKYKVHDFTGISMEILFQDSISIRTLEILEDGSLAFAGSDGVYGLYNTRSGKWRTNTIKGDSTNPSFRATGHTASDFFMLSIESPALLYKTGAEGRMQLVYAEEDSTAFYDAMKFWNDKEGIAVGDPVNGCLSILITRDGGNIWSKLPCDQLPKLAEGEAAFAASNTNIALEGDNAWIITGGIHSRVYSSTDKGQTWEVYPTPLTQGTKTQGGYSIDFYDEKTGFIIGGDYTKPGENAKNKAITHDGGKSWTLTAEGKQPGYQSCVQFVPSSEGKELISMGSTGIFYSRDAGNNWKKLSDEGFYSFRFIDNKTAYASGNGKIAKLIFEESDSTH